MRSGFAVTILALVSGLALAPRPAAAFDYYLLALSWSPSWCAEEGGGEQCAPERDLGFVLHGLWPQNAVGWPEDCASPHRDPSRRETAAMADVTGSGGLAWHQWTKHGRCSGLEPGEYFGLARLALALTALPRLEPRTTAAEVEAAFVVANPGLAPEDLVVTCRDGLLREVRICLTRELAPRRCGEDVARNACRAAGAITLPSPP